MYLWQTYFDWTRRRTGSLRSRTRDSSFRWLTSQRTSLCPVGGSPRFRSNWNINNIPHIVTRFKSFLAVVWPNKLTGLQNISKSNAYLEKMVALPSVHLQVPAAKPSVRLIKSCCVELWRVSLMRFLWESVTVNWKLGCGLQLVVWGKPSITTYATISFDSSESRVARVPCFERHLWRAWRKSSAPNSNQKQEPEVERGVVQGRVSKIKTPFQEEKIDWTLFCWFDSKKNWGKTMK